MSLKFTTDLGLIQVTDDVLLMIAGYSALECYGIVAMASKRASDGWVELLGRENLSRGVRIRATGEDQVDVDLYIIVEYGVSIAAVANTIIETVRYKIENLAGIRVGQVNIFIESIRV